MRAALRISSLARTVAPWHPAVAWAWIASSIVLVTAGISHGLDSGVRGAVAVFLGWAIVRELAPRRAVASLLAPFATVAFAIPAETDLLSCAGVLVAARVALRPAGRPPTPFDVALLVGGSAILAMRPIGLPVALVLAAVTFADSPPRRMRLVGLAMLAVALGVGAVEGTLTTRPEWSAPGLGAQVLLALLAMSAVVLVAWPLPRRLRVSDDRRDGEPLLGPRLRVGRIVTVASIAAGVAWAGSDAPFALSSASAAIVAAALGGRGARPSKE